MPARIRVANNSENNDDIAPRMLARPSNTRQPIISRALPNKSAAAPSTGCTMAKEGERGRETRSGGNAHAELAGDMWQHGIERARRQARGKGCKRNDVQRWRHALPMRPQSRLPTNALHSLR